MSQATKDRILDAAEELFAAGGYAATSLRAITSAAEVNLAAVHYHFGSKQELFRAVHARRVRPINERRLALLDTVEAGSDPPELRDVLEAFVAPAVELLADPGGARFVRLLGRMNTEPGSHWEAVFDEFDEVRRRFTAAARRLLPHLSSADIAWRFHFAIGVLSSVMANSHRLHRLSNGTCDPTDTGELLDQMIPFLTAGMRAEKTARTLDARTAAEGAEAP